MLLVAMDGVYLTSPRLKTFDRPLVLPPGARGDVAIMCNDTGTFSFLSRENPDMYNLGQQEGFASGVLMLVTVRGKRISMDAPEALPPRPAYLQDLSTRQPRTSNMTVQWDLLRLINNTAGGTDVPIYGVSGRAFNATALEPTTCVERSAEAVEQWRIINPIWICNASLPLCLTTMDREAASAALLTKYLRPVTLSHGFHMHTFKFQVFNDSNSGASYDYEPGDWRDTIMTPMAGYVDIRFQPGTYEGRVPYHCHMSPHSDRGMIAVFDVASACPARGPEPTSVAIREAAAHARAAEVKAARAAAEADAARHANAHANAGSNSNSNSSPGSTAPSPWAPALTDYTMDITTTSPRAQAHFNTGIQLAFGFAQEAAVLFFNLSLQEDPACAMCAWGMAYASGPILNQPVCPDARCGSGAAYAAHAVVLAAAEAKITHKERFLIAAIAERYSKNPDANATANFRAYAEALNNSAMIDADADIAAFYVEAVMILHASPGGDYEFYDPGTGLPVPEIAQTTPILERLLLDPATRKVLPPPRQPFAEHLYMHITEPSASGYGPNSAGRSVGVADRTRERFNGTQWPHLQHMAGHIYLRTGRYGDVVAVNELAQRSGATWLGHGLVPYGPAHNVVFLIYGACMDGQSAVAHAYGDILREIYVAAPGGCFSATTVPPGTRR